MTLSATNGFMDEALAEARLAEARGEVPIGAVIVQDRTVIARAHNLTRTLNDPTAHAELLAIRDAAARLGSQRLVGAELYVTLEPCPMCAGAISFARLARLYYGAADPKGGAVESGARLFEIETCHHRPDTYGGIHETEAGQLLKAFFAARR